MSRRRPGSPSAVPHVPSRPRSASGARRFTAFAATVFCASAFLPGAAPAGAVPADAPSAGAVQVSNGNELRKVRRNLRFGVGEDRLVSSRVEYRIAYGNADNVHLVLGQRSRLVLEIEISVSVYARGKRVNRLTEHNMLTDPNVSTMDRDL